MTFSKVTTDFALDELVESEVPSQQVDLTILPQFSNANQSVAHFDSGFNPQSYARGRMDSGLDFNVTKHCVHSIAGCKSCHVVPLLDKNGVVVNYFVEHYSSRKRIIKCTVGINGIRNCRPTTRNSEADLEIEAARILASLKGNTPEDGTDVPIQEVKIDPELQKLHLDESVITEPSDTTHLKSTLGSQMDQVQLQMKASFSTPIVKKASRCLEQLVLLVLGLQYDTSLEAIVLRCVQFLSAITDGGIVLTLKDTLMKYVANAEIPDMLAGKSVKEIFEVEQSSPNDAELFTTESMKVWDTLKQGIFTKHLSYILGTVFAFSTCKIKNVKFNHPIYEKIAEQANAEEIDGMDLIDHAIKLYNWTSTVGMACLESRSLEPLMINTTTLAKCHEKYYEWSKKFLDFKREGRSTMEERQLMFVEVETILKTLEKFVKVQREKFTTLQASSLYREVLNLFNDVRDFVQKIDRVKVAIGWHIAGPPKVGKSTFLPQLAETICLARRVDYRPEDNAQINLMAPYQDELNNATQIVTINETVPIKVQYAKSLENAYNTALALVDPVPYHPNRSNLEDKSKITMTHIGVLSTGNTDQPFLHAAQTKGAWERRYRIISMRVRPEFADEFGRLVSSKCDGSDDYHLFDVYEIVYVGTEKKIVHFRLDDKDTIDLNTEEVLEFIRREALDHYAEQDRLMNESTNNKKKGCTTCCRIARFCKCPNKDDYTTAGHSVHQVEASVATPDPNKEICQGGVMIGNRVTHCKFENGKCTRCGKAEPQNDAEMGIVGTAISTATSLAWGSVLPWINPFGKAKFLWSIDSNTMKVFHEEIIEELSYWPDTIGCTAFSMLPQSWERRADGSLSWFGKRKESFIKMVAAEKQIFLPLHYLLRRALCWGILTFVITMSFCAFMEYLGLNPRGYDQIVFKTRSYREWGWYYPYPEFSPYVMQRREYYADLGIHTEHFLDWDDYFINIYLFERVLGWICWPYYFRYTKFIPILVRAQYHWWLMPSITSLLVTVLLFFFMWWRRWLGYESRYRDLQRRCSSDPNLQAAVYDKAKRHCSEYNTLIPTAIGVIGAIATGLMIWNNIRTAPEGDIERSNGTVTWNDWFSFNREVPEPFEKKNNSASEAQGVVAKAQCEITATVNGEGRNIKGVFMRPGVLLVPRHFFKPDPFKEEILSELEINISMKGFDTKRRVYPESMERISGKDAVLIFIHKGPRIAKSCDYLLPKKSGTDHIKGKLLYLSSGTTYNETLSCKYEDDIDCAGFSCGRGVSYISKTTKKGFCGSVIMADRRDGPIIGFHIAGKTHGVSSRKGFAQEITHEDYTNALERLKTHKDYRNTPEMAALRTTRLGQNLVPNEGPHPQSRAFDEGFLPKFNGIEIVGHNPTMSKYRSRVRKSIISDAIERNCGQKNRWKAPYLKKPWVQHNAALKHIAEGAWEVPPVSAKWAYDDYLNQLRPKLKEHIAAHPELCKPLSLDEAINGVKDALYMGPWKIKTSPGIGSGTKVSAGIVEELDPYEDGRKRYKLTDEAQKYYEEMLEVFDNEQLFGVYVRSCLKDEVVAEDSEKVRIFYILECIFGLICRQAFLPLAEFLSRYPLTSECMVGVNCAGPEWEKMVQHLETLATDGQWTDWDYSKYDLKRSCDVMCMSLNLNIELCEQMAYPENWLKRMNCMAEEMRHPMVNWNGTIMFLYFWTSGNNFTVYGNSIENSLHQRISFHWNGIRILGDDFYKIGTFQENERIVTYGDDGNSACKPERRDLCGFKAKKSYFDYINMKITDARKSTSEDDAIPWEETDFLKRKSVYHPELGCRVGALHEDSIWKMGHMHSGTGEDEDLALAGMMSMLTEGFLHGKEFYEELRTNLSQCANDVGIWTDKLEVTYSERVQDWREKYAS